MFADTHKRVQVRPSSAKQFFFSFFPFSPVPPAASVHHDAQIDCCHFLWTETVHFFRRGIPMMAVNIDEGNFRAALTCSLVTTGFRLNSSWVASACFFCEPRLAASSPPHPTSITTRLVAHRTNAKQYGNEKIAQKMMVRREIHRGPLGFLERPAYLSHRKVGTSDPWNILC